MTWYLSYGRPDQAGGARRQPVRVEEMRQDATAPFSYFDPDVEVSKLRGGLLPHWRQEGVIYFVTFRLADALPQDRLKAIEEERKTWQRNNPEPHTSKQKRDYFTRFTARVQAWLDEGYGSLLLRNPDANRIVQHALCFFQGDRYELDEFVVAGNHVHVLVSPRSGFRLSEIVHSWKSYTGKKILAQPSIKKGSIARNVWQRESWDHIVRSEASLYKFREYIRAH